MTQLRLVFLGSDSIALPLLRFFSEPTGAALAKVVGVYTQPDKPSGRGQKLQPNAIKTWALEQSIPFFQPEKLGEEGPTQIRELNADIALVMAYGQLLRDDFLEALPLGVYNLHTSLLPKYRGASPISTAIANGETETAVSFMRLVRKLDAGPVADFEKVPIGTLDTAAVVEDRLSAACVPLVNRCLRGLTSGSLGFEVQNEALVSYCRRLTKNDGQLDFTLPALVLARRINGLFPWPSCSAEINGQTLKLGLADSLDSAPTGEPGIVHGADSQGLFVATSRGTLRIRQLQRPGGKMLSAAEFLRGFPIASGSRFISRTMTPLVSPMPFPRI